MVSKRFFMIFLVAILTGSASLGNQKEISNRLFVDCILREINGKIWLQRQIVYLGMVGVAWSPPFCLSDELAKKFKSLISNIEDVNKNNDIQFDTFDSELRKHKGNLIVVSLNAEFQPIFDKEFNNNKSVLLMNEPDYYKIVDANLLSAELVSASWLESWRSIDTTLKEIVTESKNSPGEEKSKHLDAIFRKGESTLIAMHKNQPNAEFKTLVNDIDTKTQITQTFAREITFRWQEWFEKFADRLDIKLQNSLPQRPKLSVALEALADSKTLTEFEEAEKNIPTEILEQFYSIDLGKKIKAMEAGNTTSFKYETLCTSAEELLPDMLKWERNSENDTKETNYKSIEVSGLVLKTADKQTLAQIQILLGMVVESVSDKHEIAGIKSGDIIVNYNHVYDVVMGWDNWDNNLESQKQMFANSIRQETTIQIIRGDKVIDLPR